MSDEIRVSAQRKESIDIDALGRALLEIVDDLDARTKKRLSTRGRKLLAVAEAAERSSGDSAA